MLEAGVEKMRWILNQHLIRSYCVTGNCSLSLNPNPIFKYVQPAEKNRDIYWAHIVDSRGKLIYRKNLNLSDDTRLCMPLLVLYKVHVADNICHPTFDGQALLAHICILNCSCILSASQNEMHGESNNQEQ